MSPLTNITRVLADQGLDNHASGWAQRLAAVTPAQVERALAEQPGHYREERLLALVSPAAAGSLEAMARQAERLTIQRFGRTIGLYAPLYVSNYCANRCLYCGFNRDSGTPRRRLSLEEAVAEAAIIRAEGFTDLLLVSSEDRAHVTLEYLADLARALREMFSSITIEIHQLAAEEYRRLFEAGVDGVTLYQETYDRATYGHYHKSGPKSDYDRRLGAQDDVACASMRRAGLGVLLGLADWRLETLALAEHASYLMKQYWTCQVSFSFPRLRPAGDVNGLAFDHLLCDADLVQMILALRLCFGDAGLVLSTREPAALRDHLIHLGITRISAGSKTNPGGYSGGEAGEQFEVADHRTACEVADMIRKHGREPVWKDWDRGFLECAGRGR
jgi:2-iminoacetate synthase